MNTRSRLRPRASGPVPGPVSGPVSADGPQRTGWWRRIRIRASFRRVSAMMRNTRSTAPKIPSSSAPQSVGALSSGAPTDAVSCSPAALPRELHRAPAAWPLRRDRSPSRLPRPRNPPTRYREKYRERRRPRSTVSIRRSGWRTHSPVEIRATSGEPLNGSRNAAPLNRTSFTVGITTGPSFPAPPPSPSFPRVPDVGGGSVLGGSVLGGSVLGGSVLGGSVLGGSVLGGSVLGGSVSADPCSADPWSADPCSADPCSADPCSADPCSADPCSADPCSPDPWSPAARWNGWRGGRTSPVPGRASSEPWAPAGSAAPINATATHAVTTGATIRRRRRNMNCRQDVFTESARCRPNAALLDRDTIPLWGPM